MLSIKEINKKRRNRGDMGLVVKLSRKVSLPFTVIAYYLNITANQISLFSFLIVIVASILISLKDYKMPIIGSLLLIFYVILDLVDGDIARLTGNATVKGDYLEAISHDLFTPLVYLGLTIKAYHHFNSIYIIYLGFFSVIFIYFTNLLRLNKYKQIIKLMQKGRKVKIPIGGMHQIMDEQKHKGSIPFFIIKTFNDTRNIAFWLLGLSILNLVHYTIFFFAAFIFVVMIGKVYIEYSSGFKEYGLK